MNAVIFIEAIACAIIILFFKPNCGREKFVKSYFSKHYSDMNYPRGECGLRNAQIGAIHSIASYFTFDNSPDAIVVMPTGSGKSAVLMMAPYALESKRILIVTPSAMVRSQIADDYSILLTLKKIGVFSVQIKNPTVLELLNIFNYEKHSKRILSSDVIVATPTVSLSISENMQMVDSFDLIVVDEAHHVPAKTWTQILANFSKAKHLLLTATPFRRDNKEITGKVIYNYPLSSAYEDGIFGQIKYVPVEPSCNNDLAIAKKAEEVFLNDQKYGYEHFIMVRTDSKSSAKELEEIYSSETSLHLKRIDSSMTNKIVKDTINDLRSRKLDGIICVDMLGEGFDFPNLKIAAIHAPHMSLSSTLQFVGRFARTNADNIGTAKFIAVNNETLTLENKRLFIENAIWQDIIIDLNENRSREVAQEKEYLDNFASSNADHEKMSEQISLHGIRSNCHAKVYKGRDFNIEACMPEFLAIKGGPFINHKDNTVVAIGEELSKPKWAIFDELVNIEYQLYIIHYQKETGLLFLYSQIKSEDIYEKIANAFCSSHQRIPKSSMHKVLGGLKDYEIFNSGMANKYSSGESYRISAGSNVSDAIDPSTGRMFEAGHAFCKAKSASETLTIGYSSGSKMWSSSYLPVYKYVEWCDENGKKLIDDSLVVKTNTNFDFLQTPQKLDKFPANIFMVDFDVNTYLLPAPIFDSEGFSQNTILDVDIEIRKVEPTLVTLSAKYKSIEEIFTCGLNGKFLSVDSIISVQKRTQAMTLADYFNEYPLVFRTTTDDRICEGDISSGNVDLSLFDSDKISIIDWEKSNTNINIEFYKDSDFPKDKERKNSIQDTVKEILLSDEKYNYIIFDHGSGETADFITSIVRDKEILVSFYHVKKMGGQKYNSDIGDIYEVTSQSIKSLIWIKSAGTLIAKIKERGYANHGVFLKGRFSDFAADLRDSNRMLRCEIVIVQPAISKSSLLPEKYQEVLSSASMHFINHGKVKEFIVWGSK